MLGATISFSLLSAIVKHLSHIPANELMLFRTLFSLSITYLQIKNIGISPFGKNKKALFMRGIFGSIALITFFISVQKMPLSTTAVLSYTTPIFTTLIGIYFIKEKVMTAQWFCFLVSFIGIILVKGFDGKVPILYFILGIISALSSAIVYNLISNIKNKEHPLVIVFYFPLVGFPVMAIWTYFNWITPIGIDWFWILLIGIFTQIGQILMTKSLQIDALSRVSSIQFLGIISSVAIGYFWFSESFNLINSFGIALVVLGVLGNIQFSSKNKIHEPTY